ncbi:MAG: pyridoxal-dependent decarboxylase [Chloroflexota bacterium]
MTPEEFRTAGHQLVDWIADYRATIEKRPVMSSVRVGDIAAQIPPSPPQKGEPFAGMLKDLDEVILPGISHWNHPNYFAYFPSNGDLSTVLGDMVSSGFSVIGLNWQSSPALTELEETMCDWLRQMLGLSDRWKGVIQDTASTTTLVALLSARERSTHHSQTRGGLQAEEAPLTVYTSNQSHSSVKKAALLAGFGLDNLQAIETDENFAVRVDLLRAAIEADIAAGKKPCAIVAATGTTATTGLDPIREIAALAHEYDMWLHVDAAMAGSAMIVPEYRWMWDGVEAADSIVFNTHKWLGVVFDCSVYYVRDSEHLIRVMSTNPSYLKTAADGEAINYRDWGIPLGRRIRSLKIWFLLRDQGIEKLQARIRRDMANAQWLKRAVERAPCWELVAPVNLQTVCLRHVPDGLTDEEVDDHNQAWADRLNESGRAYVTPAMVKGKWMVRISIGAMRTELKHVQALWESLQAGVHE